MNEKVEADGGCCGCIVMLIGLFVLIGLLGLSWKFMVWSWS